MTIFVRDDPEDIKREEDIDWKTWTQEAARNNDDIESLCVLCGDVMQPGDVFRLHPVQYEWERESKFRALAVIIHKKCIQEKTL